MSYSSKKIKTSLFSLTVNIKITIMKKEEIDFNDELLNEQDYPEYTEEDRRLETMMFFNSCGSCNKFNHYQGSAGICQKLVKERNEDNADIFRDYLDEKCNEWEIKDEYKEEYETFEF